MKNRVLFALVVLVLLTSPVWSSGSQAGSPSAGTAAQGTASGVKVTPAMAQLGFPLKNPITIKYWAVMSAAEAQVLRSYSEKSMWQNMEKISNIHIEFEHPSVAAGEAINLLLASGDLPDVIQYNLNNVSGGVDALINDKMILDLSPYLKTDMPNMSKIISDNPVIGSLLRTGEGRYWCFTKIYIDESCWAGPMLRKDLLSKWNLSVPVTIDDWYNVLTTFKNNGVSVPFGFEYVNNAATFGGYAMFIGAYGLIKGYYVGTDGNIHFGPIEDGYRQFLTMMNKWYSEGLIDPEFMAIDDATYRRKGATGIYGAFTGVSSANFGSANTELAKTIPGAGLVAAPYPKLTADQVLRFRQKSEDVRGGMNVALSAKTKYASEICRMFDYMFSPEGSMLVTYGNEGESYTLNAQGNPVATALLTSNPLADFGTIVFKYCGRNSPFLTDPYECYFLDWDNSQTSARQIWQDSAKADGMAPSYTLPAADAQTVSKIMADVNTYVDEMFLKFIMGQEPLSNFNAYVQNIKNMGIDNAIAIRNAAYAKFMGK